MNLADVQCLQVPSNTYNALVKAAESSAPLLAIGKSYTSWFTTTYNLNLTYGSRYKFTSASPNFGDKTVTKRTCRLLIGPNAASLHKLVTSAPE